MAEMKLMEPKVETYNTVYGNYMDWSVSKEIEASQHSVLPENVLTRNVVSGLNRYIFSSNKPEPLKETMQGSVYEAIDSQTGRTVIIKRAWKQLIISGKKKNGQAIPENIYYEAQILKNISKPKNAQSGVYVCLSYCIFFCFSLGSAFVCQGKCIFELFLPHKIKQRALLGQR